MLRPLLLSLALAALSGCGALSALSDAAEPLDVHEIRGPAEVPVARATQGSHLIVEVPAAGGAIATDRILVRTSPTAVAYLDDARWSEEAPLMLQSAMVQTLIRTDGFRFVGRRPIGASGDHALVTEVLEFGAEAAPGADAATVEMTLVARLVREEDARVTGSRTFTASVAVQSTATPALMAGFERVSDQVLRDLAAWVLASRGVGARAS